MLKLRRNRSAGECSTCYEDFLWLHKALKNHNSVHKTFMERGYYWCLNFCCDLHPCSPPAFYCFFFLCNWSMAVHTLSPCTVTRENLSNNTELLFSLCISIQNLLAFPTDTCSFFIPLFVHERQLRFLLFYGSGFKLFWLSQGWQHSLKKILLTIFSGVHNKCVNLMGQSNITF